MAKPSKVSEQDGEHYILAKKRVAGEWGKLRQWLRIATFYWTERR
jgi:hypothetical protein